MFKFKKEREYVFIFTTLRELPKELLKEEYKNKNVVIGLSNDDFRITIVNLRTDESEETKENELEDQLSMMIRGYDPIDYITKSIIESKEDETERVIAISLEREIIEEIAETCKNSKLRLSGIYPSFILDEQENLTDILMQLPSISVGEEVITQEEASELYEEEATENEDGENKINMVLLEHGEPLNLREKIRLGEETRYNFLNQFQANEIHNSRMFDRIVKGFWVALVLVFVGFGALKVDEYMTSENLVETTAKNKQVEGKIKELESKIAAIPNFEMKLKKLQEIMNNKNPGANEVIFALRKSATKGVFVENIKMEGSKIELVGTAETTDGIYEFQRNLVKEGFFNISSSPLNNTGQFFTFKIEANIK